MEKEWMKRRKRRDEEGQEERNKVLARGGFTSNSMILRGLEGARWGSRRGPIFIVPQKQMQHSFYRVWSPFYGDRLPPRHVSVASSTEVLLFSSGVIAHLSLSIEPPVNSRTINSNM